jgi:hypothetical protein
MKSKRRGFTIIEYSILLCAVVFALGVAYLGLRH